MCVSHNVTVGWDEVHFGESSLGSYTACEGTPRSHTCDEFCRLQPAESYIQDEEKNGWSEDKPASHEEPTLPRERAHGEPKVPRKRARGEPEVSGISQALTHGAWVVQYPS